VLQRQHQQQQQQQQPDGITSLTVTARSLCLDQSRKLTVISDQRWRALILRRELCLVKACEQHMTLLNKRSQK